MITNSNNHFSTPIRLILIISALLMLQFNVPVARSYCSSFSADCTFRPASPKLDFWQSFAEAQKQVETGKSFKIVKVESKKTVVSAQKFSWPVKGRISSGFGMRRHPVTYVRSFHNGIDIKAQRGTKIVAPVDGMVVSAGRAGLLGRMVKIKTRDGQFLYFGHLQKISCKKGQQVTRGQAIGTVGSSGRATGPHLHFSVKVNRKYANPLNYLAPR
jgi:murein DD-endopeptidase MepM/ murein hydrolase activator NlpD